MIEVAGGDYFPSSPDRELALAFAEGHDGRRAVPEARGGALGVGGELAAAVMAEEEEDGDEDEKEEGAKDTAENGTEGRGRYAMRGGGSSCGGKWGDERRG